MAHYVAKPNRELVRLKVFVYVYVIISMVTISGTDCLIRSRIIKLESRIKQLEQDVASRR